MNLQPLYIAPTTYIITINKMKNIWGMGEKQASIDVANSIKILYIRQAYCNPMKILTVKSPTFVYNMN
jgi:hypothetical protein